MKNWKKFEILWLIIATTIITGLSIYWKDTPIGIISAVTGVLCVICTGKGSLWAYIWGTINCALYGWIALESKFFWEVALNWIYYLPLQFYGFYCWKQYMNDKTGEDIATLLMWIIYLLNAIFAYIKWEKECKTIKTKKVIFNVQNWNVWRKF